MNINRKTVPVYLAAIWALLFAAASFYWAAGGKIGLDTLGDTINDLNNDSTFVAFVWLTAIVKLAMVGLAVFLLYPRHGFIPHKLVRIGAWTAGIVCVVYGGLNLAARGVMALGVIPTPESMYSTAATWHLLLWDPWWVLGGILFIWAAHQTKDIAQKA